MPPTPLVLQLQALAQSTQTDIVEVLLKAKVVASKLKLSDVAKWIDHELDGYPGGQAAGSPEDVPAYRVLPTILKAQNMFREIPVQFEATDIRADFFATGRLRQSVAHLAQMVTDPKRTDLFKAPLSASEMALLDDVDDVGGHEFYRIFTASAVGGILSAVRKRVLDWSLELEQRGILGTEMTFSTVEKELAQGVMMTIHNHGSGNATIATASNSPNARVGVASHGGTLDQAIRALTETDPKIAQGFEALRSAVAKLPDTTRPEAEEQLALLAHQCQLPPGQRQTSIASALGAGLKDKLSVTADLLAVWNQWSPQIISFVMTTLAAIK